MAILADFKWKPPLEGSVLDFRRAAFLWVSFTGNKITWMFAASPPEKAVVWEGLSFELFKLGTIRNYKRGGGRV